MNWVPKRFWTEAVAEEVDSGFTVRLDGRPVQTPAKAPFVVPSHAMAEAAAAEWRAQGDTVDPAKMPVTRSATAAIDKVSAQFVEVADMLAAYGDADLICYRADRPAGLVEQQSAAWDPLLDWAARTFDARLTPVQGVIHAAQSPSALKRLAAPLYSVTAFELTALHDLISLSGSLVIGLAARDGAFDIEALWALSRIDETWQASQWGEDAEAAKDARLKEAAFLHAHRFLDLARA